MGNCAVERAFHFGALGVYVVSMAAVIKLRRSEPELERPFRAPLHPWLPVVAIALSVVAFVSVGVGSPAVVAAFLGALALGAVAFRAAQPSSASAGSSRSPSQR